MQLVKWGQEGVREGCMFAIFKFNREIPYVLLSLSQWDRDETGHCSGLVDGPKRC